MSAPPKAAVEGFNLAAAKELALSKLPTEPPASFRAAIKSPLADALLTALATYAGEHIARLRASKELDVLRADVESGARGGGINPLDPLMANDDSLDEAEAEARFRLAADLRAQLAARADAVRATEVECDAAMRSVGSAYAAVIVKHSNREKPTVERNFFELLFALASEVLRSAFDHRHWLQLDNELGRIFRSSHFNLPERKSHGEGAKIIPARKLYALRNSTDVFVQQAAAKPSVRRSSVRAVVSERSPVLTSLLPTAAEQLRRADKAHADQLVAAHAHARDKAARQPPSARAGRPTRPSAHRLAVRARAQPARATSAATELFDADGPPSLRALGSGGGPREAADATRFIAALVDGVDAEAAELGALGGGYGGDASLDDELAREFAACDLPPPELASIREHGR